MFAPGYSVFCPPVIWLRDLANDGGEWEETYFLEGQEYKQGGIEGVDGTRRYGIHHKKTTLDGTRGEDGGRKTGYMQAMDWSPGGSVEETDCDRAGRKIYVKTSDAWI